MDYEFSEIHFYDLNRKLLLLLGLWPFEKKRTSRIKKALTITLTWMALLPQISNILLNKMEGEKLVFHCMYMTFSITITLCLCLQMSKTEALKQLLICMKIDWELQYTEEELKLKYSYTELGKFISKTFTVYVMIIWPSVILFIAYDEILSLITPTAKLEKRELAIELELFIDKEKYILLIYVYILITFTTQYVATIAITLIFIVLMIHVSGMFVVTSYRLQSILSCYDSSVDSQKKYQAIVVCVERQLKALEFISLLENTFKISAAITYCGLICASASSMAIVTNFTTTGILIFDVLLNFTLSLLGQMITDSNSKLCERLYDNYWYEYPVKIQKLLLFITMRSQIKQSFKVYSLFVLSLEEFSKTMKMIISYSMMVRKFNE